MADSGTERAEEQGRMQGGNNNLLLESIFIGMAEFFGRPEIREKWNDRTMLDVPDDIALERFQKFRPQHSMEKGEWTRLKSGLKLWKRSTEP